MQRYRSRKHGALTILRHCKQRNSQFIHITPFLQKNNQYLCETKITVKLVRASSFERWKLNRKCVCTKYEHWTVFVFCANSEHFTCTHRETTASTTIIVALHWGGEARTSYTLDDASSEKWGKSNEMKMSLFSFIRGVRACDTVAQFEFECVRMRCEVMRAKITSGYRRREQCVMYSTRHTNNAIEEKEKKMIDSDQNNKRKRRRFGSTSLGSDSVFADVSFSLLLVSA